MIVDDLEENLLALAALLANDTVEVLQARSGREALELLLEHDVALALLDVQMPEIDGFELAELMRGSERTRHVPLIFVTAGVHDRHRLFKGYELGAVDFLHKPIEAHILINKAEVFFQLYRQKQQIAQELQARTETLRFNEMFMAVLAHDLRNPLNAIFAFAHALQYAGKDAMVTDTARRILQSGRRMSRMVEDMLDVARSRLGNGITLKRDRADLGPLIQRVLQECRESSPNQSLEFVQTGDLVGDWDLDRMSQVASNLLGNALKHGEASTPIHVRLDGSDPHVVVFSVQNQGVISPELLPRIFEPFQGALQDNGRSDGLGLGLYIVHQIVQAHRGTIDVECLASEQTRFTVRLPRHLN